MRILSGPGSPAQPRVSPQSTGRAQQEEAVGVLGSAWLDVKQHPHFSPASLNPCCDDQDVYKHCQVSLGDKLAAD